jgi:hypothetical protein
MDLFLLLGFFVVSLGVFVVLPVLPGPTQVGVGLHYFYLTTENSIEIIGF